MFQLLLAAKWLLIRIPGRVEARESVCWCPLCFLGNFWVSIFSFWHQEITLFVFSCTGSPLCFKSCCFSTSHHTSLQHISSPTGNSFWHFNVYIPDVDGHLIEVQWSLYSDHLQQWTSTLSNYRWMDRDFHGCSPLWRTNCPRSHVRSDPEPQHFFVVLLHSTESSQRYTGFVFILASWRTQVACCPPKHFFSASGAVKNGRSTWSSRCFCSSRSGELKRSPEEHALSSFEVESQRVLEILDSIGGYQRYSVMKSFVHCCISDKSVLQWWSSFSWFKHC